uniref:Uncharacterized protein n=1 Tax=Panagrolaimus superbus TaxID=310955 RepID=A0A914Y7T6_9BILA
MFERDGNMCKNKNGKQQNGMNSSNGCEFENVIQAFGRNAGILDELSDRSSQVIVDVLDQEEITHEEVEKRCKEICEAEYFHLKNAPIRVEDLPPKISIEDFRQKLYELQKRTDFRN